MLIEFIPLVTLADIIKISSTFRGASTCNTHHDVTDLVNHGMVKSTKT